MHKGLCRRRMIVVFLSAACVTSASLAVAPLAAAPKVLHEPVDIVTEIYRVAAGPNGKYEGASAIDNKELQKLYFTKSLVAALIAMEKRSKKRNEPILDFDPITNSQDPSVKNLTITEETKSADKAAVAAKFFAFEEKQPSIVHYDFVKVGADWKLDELRGESGSDKTLSWSLRKIISQ